MDKYNLRRVILKILRPVDVVPMTVSDMMDAPQIAMRIEQGLLTQEQLVTELKGLAERGYIKDLKPGRAPLWRITAIGRGQIDREDDLHEYVWGEYASRFAE